MLWAFNFFSYRIAFSIVKVEKCIGVTSLTKDERHILMWDFDEVPLVLVEQALREVQWRERLPNVFILETSKDSYVAYCFKKFNFDEALRIVCSTKHVDSAFTLMSLKRSKFTLRIGPKTNKPHPHLVKVLESPFPQDATLADLKAFVRYQTKYGE
jgi:hypothetical protein